MASDPWAVVAVEQDDPWAVASVEDIPQTPQRGRRLQETGARAVGETALALGTGAIAAPIAGWAGILAGGARALGMESAEPADVVRSVQGALTYQPRSEEGQTGAEVVSYPFRKLAEGADYVGGKVADVTGSPALGAGVNTAIQMAPALAFTRRGGKISKAGPVRATAETAAREWVSARVGVDWNSVPAALREQLTTIASDARNLQKLDPAAVQRQIRLASLEPPVPATRGQVTRDPVALRNEGNVSATEAGRPIRDIYIEQNRALLENIEGQRPKVGERPATPEAAGQVVQGAARAKLARVEAEVRSLYTKADEAGETAVKVDVTPILQQIRATPDRTHYRWAESWIRQMTTKEKKGAVPLPRNMKTPAPAEDSVLQFLAKTNRGLSVEEAVKQGLDPADFRLPTARLGSRPAFRKGGMSFDEAAQMLDEAGYPVRDRSGNYDPNVLLDVIDGELRGRPAYSTQNTRLVAEMETQRAEIGKLAEKARQIDPDGAEALLESQMDDAALAGELRRMVGQDKPPVRLSIRELEDLRKAAVARAKDGGTAGHYAGQLIKVIDETTEGAGGNLYKQARAARKAQAMEFEEQAGVARLVENKSRTDPATTVEDTWRATVMRGSIDDLRNARKTLLTSGRGGREAWRAIQQQTIDEIVNTATRSAAKFEDGTPNVTAAALKQAIRQVEPAKLDVIFGPGASVRFQRILDAAADVKTAPPIPPVGSTTMMNFLAGAERFLVKVPVVGNTAAGVVAGAAKLRQWGAAGRDTRAAQTSPVSEAAAARLRAIQRMQERKEAAGAAAATVGENARQRPDK